MWNIDMFLFSVWAQNAFLSTIIRAGVLYQLSTNYEHLNGFKNDLSILYKTNGPCPLNRAKKKIVD